MAHPNARRLAAAALLTLSPTVAVACGDDEPSTTTGDEVTTTEAMTDDTMTDDTMTDQ